MVSPARAGSPVRSMLRHMSVAGLTGLLLVPAVAGLLGGGRAAFSALVGVLLVSVVMFLGFAGITVVTNGPTALSMAGAAIVFLGQLILVVAAIAALRDAHWLHGAALSMAAIAQVVLLQVGQVVGYLRARHVLLLHAPGGAC